jgi:hypothetical protein
MSNELVPTVNEVKRGFWARVVDLYVDGFRSMTVGKTLWLIIAIKLFIFFVIIKILFFPDFLASKSDSDDGKAQYVRQQLIDK